MTGHRSARAGIVTSSFFPLRGGAERQCLMLARALKREHGLAWVLTQQIDPDSLRYEEIKGIPVYRRGLVAMWRRLIRYFRGVSPPDVETAYEKDLRRRG